MDAGVLIAGASLAQDKWTFEKPYVWARDKDAVTLAREGDVFVVKHTGKQDWSLAGFPHVAAKPGDIFELVCKVKTADAQEWANAETGVVLRDEKGNATDWPYGGTSASAPCEWTELKSRFIVPKGVATVEPRLIGHGAVTVRAEGYVIARAGTVLGRVNPQMKAQQKVSIGDLSLSGDFVAGFIDVSDGRTGRSWRMDLAAQGWMVLNAEPLKTADGISLTLLNPETTREIRATLTLAAQNEMAVAVDSDGSLTKPLDFPPPLETRKGDRLIVPVNEGMSYPVECYHPDHPQTRSDSRKHKMELLKLIGEFGLVCGSETGHEASVPFCDYHEGMLSVGPCRSPKIATEDYGDPIPPSRRRSAGSWR